MIKNEAQLFGRGFAFPPKIGPGGGWSFSSGPQNVRESIRVILTTEPLERVMLPEFGGGLRRFLFRTSSAATFRLIEEVITRALGRWEPRIDVESVVVEESSDDPSGARAIIRYKLVATQAEDQINVHVVLS